MLESRILTLGPWSPLGGSAQRRIIRTHDGSVILGKAERRWKLSIPLLRLRWRPIIRLYETEDSSLVCTAYVTSSENWEVRDAENRLIGSGQRERRAFQNGPVVRVVDSSGGPIATIGGFGARECCRVVNPLGHELARACHDSSSTTAEFAAVLDSNPFTKMLVLMAIIIQP
jgi:hypothetical protein